MKLIEKFQDKVVTSIAVFLFIVSCLWMLIEAISRQVFSISYAISEEVIVFTLIWAIFLTLGQGGKEGNHILVDLFTSRFGAKTKKITTIITNIIGLSYGAFLVYVGVAYIEHLFSTGITSHSPLRLPMGYVYFAVPIGMLFFSFFYLHSLAKELYGKN